jgi:hypothetical protein
MVVLQFAWGFRVLGFFSRPRREAIGAPGMVVLQFAWGGGPGNVHLPHNHYENCFVYPGELCFVCAFA